MTQFETVTFTAPSEPEFVVAFMYGDTTGLDADMATWVDTFLADRAAEHGFFTIVGHDGAGTYTAHVPSCPFTCLQAHDPVAAEALAQAWVSATDLDELYAISRFYRRTTGLGTAIAGFLDGMAFAGWVPERDFAIIRDRAWTFLDGIGAKAEGGK